VIAEQLLLAGVVTVRIRRVIVSEPAAYTAGYVGDEGPLGASGDVGPGVTKGTVAVAASDVSVMSVGHVMSPRARCLHPRTMTVAVDEGKRSATDGLRHATSTRAVRPC
jgi:hypothetical protein